MTQGRRTGSREERRQVIEQWDGRNRAEGLTLVANRFVRTERTWGAIQVATYLFPDEASLADEYLDATIRYLEVYSQLLGPYPHAQFAVVENFFPGGLGMPSFTLLGSAEIKRHYVKPFALGHEIVHGWIGNGVLNEPESGNWVEGLTTYLANYYFDEWSGHAQEAREQRRRMLMEYAVYIRPEADYPVQEFRHKTSPRDNAIGYQKAAMVFHMLRREIGDEPFWRALKQLIQDRNGRYTSWSHLQQAFGDAAGRDLGWFFGQWLERPGAPVLALELLSPNSTDRRQIQARLVQQGTPYRLRVPLELELTTGDRRRTEIRLNSAEQDVTLSVATPASSMRADPDFELFRRIDRHELPPMLNLFVTDRQRTVILPATSAESGPSPYKELASRLQSDPEALGSVSVVQQPDPGSVRGSVLVLGGPDINPAVEWVQEACGDKVRLDADGFTVDGRQYDGQDLALLLSCWDPQQPDRTVTLFYGTTTDAAMKVARLLFFYGWQSYLVFRDGTVAARGDFPVARQSVEVNLDPSR